MFLGHYAWRSFAYPLLQRGGKPTSIFIWLLAVAFCMYNGLLQVQSLLADCSPASVMHALMDELAVTQALVWGCICSKAVSQ